MAKIAWNKIDAAKFWKRVKKSSSGCWEWTGAVFAKSGYGQLTVAGWPVGAHRASWFLHTGKPPVKCVLHACDNRLCVNPKHLFSGSKGDNNRDTVAKFRHRYGSKHWKAVLTAQDIADIKYRYYACGELQREIGEFYGVGQPHISSIVRNKAWTHLEKLSG